jgi:hypothetical protein
MNDTTKADKYDLCWKVINTIRAAKGLPLTAYNNKYREVVADDITAILKGSPRPENGKEPKEKQAP